MSFYLYTDMNINPLYSSGAPRGEELVSTIATAFPVAADGPVSCGTGQPEPHGESGSQVTWPVTEKKLPGLEPVLTDRLCNNDDGGLMAGRRDCRTRAIPRKGNASSPGAGRLACAILASLAVTLALPTRSAAIDLTGTPVSAYNDTACIGTRAGTDLGCQAKEFTVGATFSAAPNTPPFCVAGNSFDFLVDLQLSGSNANRYDISFYTGQTGNSPDINDATKSCSATAFPLSLPAPWGNLDGNSNLCADYVAAGDSIIRINQIKVKCEGDAAGYLQVPYTLAYEQNTGNPTCNPTTPSTYPVPTKSKCQTGISSVSGTVQVFSGAYVDVTKQTLPDGDGQSFSFSASGPAGSYVIALTDSTTLSQPQPSDGTYTPTTAAAATNSVSAIPLSDGKTTRFYLNALTTARTLTITEAAATNWETTAAITCANVTGTPNPTFNTGTRTITASLSTANSAAACTITNTKRSRITLAKSVGGRFDAADQFTVSASGGGTLSGTTSATTTGAGTTASTTFYSSPGSALTLTDAKAAGPTALTSYYSTLTCTNAFTGSGATPNSSLPNGLATTGTSITPAPGDDITCTYSNTPRTRVTISKTLSPTGDSGTFNLLAGATTVAAAVGNGGSGNTLVPPGIPLTVSETAAGATSLTNYDTTYSCSGGGISGTLTGSGASISLSAGQLTAGSSISCSFTNTRKATVTVSKSLTPAGDSGTFNLRVGGVTVASAVGNGGSGSTLVAANGALTVSETGAGATSLANYDTTYSCSGGGISGSLSGSGSSVSLTAGQVTAGGSISCSFSNTRKATITVSKSLSPFGDPGTFNLRVGAVTVAAAVGNGGSGSASVTANATVTVSETAAGSISLIYYDSSYSCSGGISGSGTSVSITPAPGQAISCSFTNSRKLPLIAILKSANAGAANPGQVITYTVQIANSGNGDGISVVMRDDLSPYTAFGLDTYGPGIPFSFTDSSPASGLTLGTPEYSSDNGSTWTYLPTSGGGGAPAGYDGSVTNWRIPMAGTIRVGGSVSINYQTTVK
jgi:uncharacterized repeat protein (TIGR01451 family)